jgi:hypothetical protein
MGRTVRPGRSQNLSFEEVNPHQSKRRSFIMTKIVLIACLFIIVGGLALVAPELLRDFAVMPTALAQPDGQAPLSIATRVREVIITLSLPGA